MFYDEHERVCPDCGETFCGQGLMNGVPMSTWLLLGHVSEAGAHHRVPSLV